MRHILSKLGQDELYIKSWQPFDFKNMGQKAIEITYTNGDTDMLTTSIDPNRGNDKGDFKDESELKQFADYLINKGIPRT